MHQFKPFYVKINLLLVVLAFLLVGCSGEVQTAMTTGAISIAQRGESLLTPGGGDFEEAGSAATQPLEASKTTELTATPQITATAEMPTLTVAAASVTTQPLATDTPTGEVEGDQTVGTSNACEAKENRGFEAEVITLVNEYREEVGIRALAEQSQLTQAARLHSLDMACNQFFSHLSKTAGTLIDRVEVQNYQYSSVGENIAAGHVTPSEVVESWMSSPGHRENLMNPQFTQAGIGYIHVAESPYEIYWTIIVGSP